MQDFPSLESLRLHLAQHHPQLVDSFTHMCEQPAPKALLERIAQCSPYLTGLIQRYPDTYIHFCEHGASATLRHVLHELNESTLMLEQAQALMRPLRIAKGKAALTIALADISGTWTLEEITAALSNLADVSLNLCMDGLLREAHHSGKITLTNPFNPQDNCGIFVLAMGKLGSESLNYSSDIDLIILFEPQRIHYNGRQSVQHFMTRFAQDLVTLMQERTKEGYVFRTDLRLRPDPASTPPAISTDAAITYYEKVGQNWERAAMIKARIAAGDRDAGEQFLSAIQPFVWRRHLDFAAINDILSIKRQMHRNHSDELKAAGHNIKTGIGGIREIEFFGQIFQLIWGGKRPELRIKGTIATLKKLQQLEMANKSVIASLCESYRFLRTVEHRLQMMADEQTQTIPTDEEQLARLSLFLGYLKPKDFCNELESHLKLVHAHYLAAFRDSEPLSTEGNLVFTGVDHDADTIETLRNMGFSHPEAISTAVQDWHKGNRRCTRTHRSRELLTELMPSLLKALSETSHPDEAFARMDEFLSRLPAGVQIFSLFTSNPELLSAPALGDALSHDPHLIEAALLGDFYDTLPDANSLRHTLQEQLNYARNEEDALMMLHRFRKEKMFQAGVQLLKGMVDTAGVGLFLSHVADVLLESAITTTMHAFAQQYGTIEGGKLGVIALGRLGTREMTFTSDIDLIFVYKDTETTASNGEKILATPVYYNRLCQRLIGTFTAPSRYGKLYDVDTRLRPFGNDGTLAVRLSSLSQYYSESAWVFEKLALTRGRVLFATDGFADELHNMIERSRRASLPAKDIAAAIHEMRAKISKQFPTDNPWHIKYVQGGLMDCDFIVQYWMLLYGSPHDAAQHTTVPARLQQLSTTHPHLRASIAIVMQARQFLTTLLFYLRLCSDGSLDESSAPNGLKNILVNATHLEDFDTVKRTLISIESTIHSMLWLLSHEAK